MRLYLLPLAAALSVSACAPRALFFHESTKVAFAADYNTSDTQPLATSFGYKRRIVAVVPGQERVIQEGQSERSGTNSGEALSLVSKFNVRAGTGEGVSITNNFASGMAARIMTDTAPPEAIGIMMHSPPIAVSAETGRTIDGNRPVAEVVAERVAGMKRVESREVSASNAPRGSGALPMPPKKPVPHSSGPIQMPPKKPAPPSTGPLPMPQKNPNEVPESSGVLPLPPKPNP